MSVRLVIPGRFSAWRVQNFYRGVNKYQRTALAREAHEHVYWAVREQLGPEPPRFTVPVVITVTEHCVYPPDASNSVQKVVLDGLVHAGLIEDDDYRRVSELRLRSRKASADEERIEIIIEEAE